MYDLKIYFLLFIIYSVVGWIIEMIDVAILNKKIVNKIKTLPIESMSPIEVMNFIYELKQSLEKEEI